MRKRGRSVYRAICAQQAEKQVGRRKRLTEFTLAGHGRTQLPGAKGEMHQTWLDFLYWGSAPEG